MANGADPRQALRLLKFLSQNPGCTGFDVKDTKESKVLLRAPSGASAMCAPDDLEALEAAELVVRNESEINLTSTGQMRLKRLIAKRDPVQSELGQFRAQHLDVSKRTVMYDGQSQNVLANDAESPLLRLHRLKAPTGGTWLDDAAFAAGERLRADFTHGRLMQRTTSSWNFEAGKNTRSGASRINITDQAMDARARLERALDTVGPELAGVLLDVCCFLKGLESVERERRWPARSAKLMLRTGLNLLARHYGTNAGSGRRTTRTRSFA